MTTDLAGIEAPIERDRYNRPLVKPVGQLNAKPIPYTRCTTYIDCLDDRYNLERWKMRMVALGLADRPDLMLAVAASDRDDKKALDAITEQAQEAAKAKAAATIGSAIHALTQRIDLSQEIGVIPDTYKADLDAYTQATADMDMLEIERFVVQDTLKIGGTPDRVARIGDHSYILDIKTGSIDFAALKIAMQLAVYSRSLIYDPTTGRRSPLPDDLDNTRGIVAHLPAGQGRCEMKWVDLTAGWQAVTVATHVRTWRKRRDLFSDYTEPEPEAPDVPGATDSLETAVACAASVDDLNALYWANETEWTPALTGLAAARKAELTGSDQA